MNQTTEKKDTNRTAIIILVGLLVCSLIGNIYLLSRSTTAESLVSEKTVEVDSLKEVKKTLESDFQTMTYELDQFKGKNIQLDSLLEKANGDIENKKRKIEKLIKENKDIPLIRRQMEEMRVIRDQYRIQIDQLIKENKDLKFANINLSQEVDNLNKTTQDLSQKVEIASVLKAEAITVKTMRDKGKGKFEDTEKAKRVGKIRTVFVVAENKVAKPGTREVVLRILKPDGYVLTNPTNGSGDFTKEDGRTTEYSMRKTIEYANERSEVTFDWEQSDELKAGFYISEVYLDGKVMGNYKFTLK
jgi:hypothetical protein